METKNQNTDSYNKTCKFERCKKPFVARRLNQEFCSPSHHSHHNNSLARVRRNLVKGVNAILLKNRNILERLKQMGKEKILVEELIQQGFVMNYCSHLLINRELNKYIFMCYEFGIVEVETKKYNIVKQ